MAILISSNTYVMIQGITGKEGQRALLAMRQYHTKVVCGVTPGKGGQTVEGVPVYNTVGEAKKYHPEITASAVYVPPHSAKSAILESIESGIPLINVIVERIPLCDTAFVLAAAREHGVRIIGPSSVGIIAPGIGRIGLIGGPEPEEIYTPGLVGIISRSGAMTNELSWVVRSAGAGQSTAVGMGGDLLVGTSYGFLLEQFEQDPHTRAIVIFGEMGGLYEYDIVALRDAGIITKPVIIIIAGKFSEHLPMPEGASLGHAGAIIERGRGSIRAKEKALRDAGVVVASDFEQLPELICSAISE